MKRARLNPTINDPEVAVRTTEKTELDLFSNPVEQDVILSAKDYQYGIDYAITDTGPIEFSPVTGGEYFTDLANTYIMVKLKVTKANRGNLAKLDEEKVNKMKNFPDELYLLSGSTGR